MISRGVSLTPLEMLARLVSFDTESEKSNLALIAFVEDYLRSWGVPSVRVPDSSGEKAALFATLGPQERGGVVLSGHSDVVPVAGQAWSRDPFALHLADGRAYGRGAVDMKAFIALVLALVPDFLAANLSLPVHLLLSYDEETTCLGSVDTIGRMGKDLPMPMAAIVGEPTSLQVADAHKSCVMFTTTVHGFAAHSAKPYLGANAVMAAAEVVAELNRISDDMVAGGDRSGRFDPPYTTVEAGIINGGTARNILAKECVVQWEFRGLPDLDPDMIPLRIAAASARIEKERLNRHGPFGRIETARHVGVPGLRPQPGSAAEKLALELTGSAGTVTVSFATESGHFQDAGIPTVVCGPGSIDQAHQPDEYISLDQFAAGEAFMRRLALKCASGTI